MLCDKRLRCSRVWRALSNQASLNAHPTELKRMMPLVFCCITFLQASSTSAFSSCCVHVHRRPHLLRGTRDTIKTRCTQVLSVDPSRNLCNITYSAFVESIWRRGTTFCCAPLLMTAPKAIKTSGILVHISFWWALQGQVEAIWSKEQQKLRSRKACTSPSLMHQKRRKMVHPPHLCECVGHQGFVLRGS